VTITAQQAWQVFQQAEQIYSKVQVDEALDNIAADISRDLAGHNPLIICVMSGALVTMGQLLTRLHFPLEIDYVHASRYRGETRGSELHWLARPQSNLKGRTVIVVDDILDEGYTLAAILKDFREHGASDVRSAVLVNKIHQRRLDNLQADYVGLDVEDRYVFGYGMDYHNYLRNVDGIYAVAE
jgi:hypoxanthine phosphoribosyltransferase